MARPTPHAAVILLVSLGAALAGCVSNDAAAPAPTTPPPVNAAPYRAFLAPGDPYPSSGAAAEPVRHGDPINYLVTARVGPANELVIAVNPKNPQHLVAGAKDYWLGTEHPCDGNYPINVWTGVFTSLDGGRTWAEALTPGHPRDDANATHPLRIFACNSDPVVAFAQDGTAYYSGLGIRGPGTPLPTHPCVETSSSIWLLSSDDAGETWGDFSCAAAATVTPRPEFDRAVDRQWFIVDEPYIYFTYMEFGPTDLAIKFRRSTDGGATWDPPVTLVQSPEADAPDAPLHEEQYAMPGVGPNGEVYVTVRSFGEGGGIWFTKSTDHGATFTPTRRIALVDGVPRYFVDGLYRAGSYPVLAVDAGDGPHSGDLHLAWADDRGGDPDILHVQSSDAGATWSEAEPLSANPPGDGTYQFLPWITIAPNGHVHAMWMDNRSHGNLTRLDAYHRVSLDGGKSWEPELRVNAATVETELCHHQSGANFIGDYVGLAASDVSVHPFWPSGHEGRCNGYTATVLA